MWADHQPTASHFGVVPGADDVRPISQDQVKVIAHHGKGQQVDTEVGGKMLEHFLDPFLAVIEVFSGQQIVAEEKTSPNGAVQTWTTFTSVESMTSQRALRMRSGSVTANSEHKTTVDLRS